MFCDRVLAQAVRARSARNKVRLVFGARQTGKTVLLRNVTAAGSTAYYDLAAPSERRRFEMDPGAFAREVRALPPRSRNVVVDEIQKVPDLLDEIQSLYDANPTRFQFFLTGSSSRKLRQRSSNFLPGRSHVFRLFPVCAWERADGDRFDWAGAAPAASMAAASGSRFPAQALDRLLLLGSLPGVSMEAPKTAAATLAAYVENYLEEEIRREALVRDLGAFGVFLKLAAVESGRQVNLAKLSQESGVSASTLRTFYDVLSDTFVGRWLHPYGRPGRKRLLTTPRFLFFDTGVRNAAADLPVDRRILEVEGGPLLEQWVGLELLSRATYRGRGHDVGFWRTVTGAEVDYVWQGPREDVPIEVKWTARPQPGDARHVETFLTEYPRRARRGLVVCRCERPQQLTERVTAIPWSML